MPYYQVRMRMGEASDSPCKLIRVPFRWRRALSLGEIERRARAKAVETFGPQATDWTLLDAERRTR